MRSFLWFILSLLNFYSTHSQILTTNDTSCVYYNKSSMLYFFRYDKLNDGNYIFVNDSNQIINRFQVSNHTPVGWMHCNYFGINRSVYNNNDFEGEFSFSDSSSLRSMNMTSDFVQYNMEFYPNQTLKDFRIYFIKTKKSIERKFYDNGQIRSVVKTINGEYIPGDSIVIFNSDGSKREVMNFIDKDNCMVSIFDGGVLFQSGQYINTEAETENGFREYGLFKNGEWKYYNKNGVIIKEEQYKNGELVK